MDATRVKPSKPSTGTEGTGKPLYGTGKCSACEGTGKAFGVGMGYRS
jgi:hypothetical protein